MSRFTALYSLIFLGVCTSCPAQQDPRQRPVHPVIIKTAPSPIIRQAGFSSSASFTMPAAPGNCGFTMRIYNYTGDDPDFDKTPYLTQAGSFTPVEPAGTKIDASFETMRLPPKAGEKIELVLFTVCELRRPRDIRNGQIIWEYIVKGSPVGSATFHLECTGRHRDRFCTYRPD